jgi:UDP-N-acetylglucosamine 2-epimerase (non-hydrolysing)
MKITLIAGARPNFMKIAPIIKAIDKRRRSGASITYRLVHTGQHYDKALSETFFKELSIPEPDANLEVGSGSQAVQTANIMVRFEEELLKHPADVVLVVGDINSTMACSIVAKKLNTQLVHVEAGIRSFDLSMPEEINRMVTDSLADHFFTTSEVANKNLLRSGVDPTRIHFVGNTMIDTLLCHRENFTKPSVWDQYSLTPGNYMVLTLHRPSNVDDLDVLSKVISNIVVASNNIPVIFPAHPRTVNNLKKLQLSMNNIITIEPLGYLSFMYLVQHSKAVVTDSGGLQEETTVLGIPCITLRKNSERPETIDIGTNELVPDLEQLSFWTKKVFDNQWKKGATPQFWDGKTSDRIVDILYGIYS